MLGYKFGEFNQFPLPQMLSSSMEEVVLQSKATLNPKPYTLNPKPSA